jgi:hypothetical protein
VRTEDPPLKLRLEPEPEPEPELVRTAHPTL